MNCDRPIVIKQIKEETSRIMHLHYCENNVEEVIRRFGRDFSWFGAGEEQYVYGREQAVKSFRHFDGMLPKCRIWEEHYDVIEASESIFICSGMLWIATDSSARMYVKVHQRVTFVYRLEEGGLKCIHIHCSNPYMEMLEGEQFPEKIGRQSYEYVQETLRRMEEEMRQKNRQLEVIMASVPGGLKISRDDEKYSYAYVSPEAASLFGYTVEEFLEATGGTAVGAVYPPDLEKTMEGVAEDFKDGRIQYAQKYRIRCKDGSLKWVLDSGRKSIDESGNTLINSLYLDITKAEENAGKLREQKEMLSSILNTVPCGILRFEMNGKNYKLLSANPAAVKLLGYKDREAFLQDWKNGLADTVLREDIPILYHSYGDLKNLGDRNEIEYRVRWQDGSIHWLKGSNTVVSVAGDTLVIQRMFFEVTESRTLEEQLMREQEMYRLAMESSSDVMYEYLVEEDEMVTYEPKIGRDGKTWIERNTFSHYRKLLDAGKIVHPEDVRIVMEQICQGKAGVFEARFCSPEVPKGERYWWYRVSGKLVSREGKPYRVVGTIRNIHREKQVLKSNRDALRMNQAALQAISGAYISIHFVDLKQDLSYSVTLPGMGNQGPYQSREHFMEEMKCYIRTNVEESDRDRVIHFLSPQHLKYHLRHVHDSMGIEYSESRDGKKQWLRMDLYLVSKEEEEIRNIILTFRNITVDRRKELEHRQEEEKAKKALEEAYASARQANLAKSEFLSRMSHDIRTPMNAVMGMTAIAEKNLDDAEKLKDCLEKIRMSSRHLLYLINEVLDMSKIESGNAGLKEAPFHIREMLSDTAEIISQEIREKKQRFEIKTGRMRHEKVTGDMVRVQQILLNLLSNAVKYTPEGGYILMECQEVSDPSNGIGCYVMVVEDNGIGISEEFQKRIFQPFERAEDSRVSKIQGTGLGMSITQNLVQMMGGTIEVESQLNKGSRFTVTLSLKPADSEEGERRIKQESTDKKKKKELSGRGKRILLVEDNDLNREIARELLKMEQFEIEEARDGREAVEKFRQSPNGYYQIILMDIQMPVMNGYEAARAIRKLDREDATEVPVIALTANAFADDIYAARQAGMNAHLSKPLDMEKVAEALERWLI